MNFPSIRIEGAILSSDILDRIEDLPGQKASDFGLGPSVKVKDEIARAWADAQDYWRIFQRKIETLRLESPATSETRQQWVAPLLALLGYQIEHHARAAELNGKLYAISHRATNRANAPIQIVGYREAAGLDRKPENAAVRMSAHAVVQEFINLNEQLYGIVTNGRVLRLLRDSSRLIKLSYLEFDLERIFTDGLFADFAVFYRLLHATRLPQTSETASESLIERYHQESIEQGTRIRAGLRAAVTEALEILGTGFVKHVANTGLREQIQSGALDGPTLYSNLLRLIYRVLFLNVVEERGLIFPKGTPASRINTYSSYYSLHRLRRLTQVRGLRTERHHDLWLSLLATFQIFENPTQAEKLGATAFGGQLFDHTSLGLLSNCRLSNASLLYALDRLCSFDDPKTGQRIPVNFGALATEEFGSVYESLLELHPITEVSPTPRFGFKQAGGSDRKTSASYYTSTPLVDALLDRALEPILAVRLRDYAPLGYPDRESAILSLKICDPACGSGHFLIATAQRIARRLALVRAGDDEPSPDQLRHALRQVIGKCIYAVDINPMAVELCRVALWLEAVEPGKPLSFLDHHVQVGNALMGTTPALMAKGIPDGAYTPVEGDVNVRCSELKSLNQREREDYVNRQGYLFEPPLKLGNMTESFAWLSSAPDGTVADIAALQNRYAELVRGNEYQFGSLLADTWCAAFVWKKDESEIGRLCPTEREFRRVESHAGYGVLPQVRDEVQRLSTYYRFFHWHLRFPEVFRLPSEGETPENQEAGWSGGFDLTLGNPPWDTLSPDAKEFFAVFDPQVRFEDRDGQNRIIDRLLQEPGIAARWNSTCRDLYALVHFIKRSGRYNMFAPGNLGKGDFNVYRMFVETALTHTRKNGWAGQVVPEGLYNGANCMAIRRALYGACRLDSIVGFENNAEVWFPGVHTAMKFCIYAAQVGGKSEVFRIAFNVRSHEQLAEVLAGRSLQMPVRLVAEFSPDALALMEFQRQLDIDIAEKMYRWPAFGDSKATGPEHVFSREVDMGTDRDLFSEATDGLPLYEGRMVDQFDYRAKGYRSGRGRSAVWEDLSFANPRKSVQPQWYVPIDRIPDKCSSRTRTYRIGFCDVTGPTNERTLIAALLPPHTICGHIVPTILFEEQRSQWRLLYWLAVANSYVVDYIARKKVSLHMSYTVVESLPFPVVDRNDPRARCLVTLSARLSCAGPEMIDFWNELASDGWVPAASSGSLVAGELDEARRLQLRAEIDAIVARDLFNLTRSELEYVLDVFPTQRRYQETQFGEFRSRRLILEAFDTPQGAGR